MAQAPLQRNSQVDALYKNEALPLIDFGGQFHVAANTSFAVQPAGGFSNPLAGVDASSKLRAATADTGDYYVFVPQAVVKACVAAQNSGTAAPTLDVTVFFDPFSTNTTLFQSGLRSVFAARASEMKVVVCVPGNEDSGNWGIGITNSQIAALLARCNAGYSKVRVSTLAAWSNGYKGMLATMRAAGHVADIMETKDLQRVIFYDCLYFTNESRGLVDDALSKVQARIAAAGSGQQLQVIAYLATTPGGNDSLDPAAIAAGIPFIKKHNLAQGLIVLNDSIRVTLRKLCIVRAMAWAKSEGALPGFNIPGVLQAAFEVIDAVPRNTVTSLPSLPYGKGTPPGSTDLASYAADPRNAAVARLNVNSSEFSAAVVAVNAGAMIFGGTFPSNEVDHMVIMPELAWEFLAG